MNARIETGQKNVENGFNNGETVMNTTDLYELSADEIDQVSGGEYKEYFNFKVAGMHVWGGSYDGHAFTCVSDGKSGSCKIEGAK